MRIKCLKGKHLGTEASKMKVFLQNGVSLVKTKNTSPTKLRKTSFFVLFNFFLFTLPLEMDVKLIVVFWVNTVIFKNASNVL